ncbi:NUDIX domain-containing protein [Empedobacter falsenii]|uniref:NUDIX domain-containing protein n=1 Tax=Empedobacter falsenii TaxID=343874 RepID=UPI00257496CB|nr:NUDIX hydrolase [Empedobacter falsenii]
MPGGRLEPNELSKETLEREIYEELNIKCKVSKIVDSWVFEVIPNKIIISKEHSNFGLFNLEELEHMDIPKGYLNSIKYLYRRLFNLFT